jgi:hypothetical protein
MARTIALATRHPSLYAKSVASAEAIESFDQAVATLVRIGGAQRAGIARSTLPPV